MLDSVCCFRNPESRKINNLVLISFRLARSRALPRRATPATFRPDRSFPVKCKKFPCSQGIPRSRRPGRCDRIPRRWVRAAAGASFAEL